eukprot:1159241-Pelagomonas_calceolata.AAC.6
MPVQVLLIVAALHALVAASLHAQVAAILLAQVAAVSARIGCSGSACSPSLSWLSSCEFVAKAAVELISGVQRCKQRWNAGQGARPGLRECVACLVTLSKAIAQHLAAFHYKLMFQGLAAFPGRRSGQWTQQNSVWILKGLCPTRERHPTLPSFVAAAIERLESIYIPGTREQHEA